MTKTPKSGLKWLGTNATAHMYIYCLLIVFLFTVCHTLKPQYNTVLQSVIDQHKVECSCKVEAK